VGQRRIPGCVDDPAAEVNVARIQGVDPAVAVAVEGGDWPYAWLAPGYLVDSPRHPLHDAIYGSPDEPNAEDGFLCGRPRALRAHALNTPAHDLAFLTVADEDEAAQPFLRRNGVDGIVTHRHSRRPHGLRGLRAPRHPVRAKGGSV
jgi:hypothetical protein